MKKEANKPGDISQILDQSDDSLENENNFMDDSFDREDDDSDITPAAKLIKAKSVITEEEKKSSNLNIQNFLESSLNINISNPKNLEEDQDSSTFQKAPTTESDISLLESDNTQSLKFYESSKDNGKLHQLNQHYRYLNHPKIK